MKKFKAINLLIVMLTLLVSLCFAVGCNNNSSGGNNSSESHISFNSFTVQGNKVYGTVSNATEVFDFASEITAGKKCEYVVSLDEFGIQTSLTKTVPLAIGNNTFYIFESVDGVTKNTFFVTIRRKPIYTVTFNSNGGTAIQSQTVEEGYLASAPTEQITKPGYTFTGWDFDFTAPITQSITIDAKFEVKPEMANFNFTSNFSTCKITGLKDNTVTQVVIPDYVTSISDNAFRYCCKLAEVINKSSHITITKGSSSNGYIGYYALSVSNRDNTYVSKLTNDNGYIIYTDGAEKVLVGYTGTETALTLPSYVTKINQYAFYNCDSLTSIEIPDSVTSIGDYAFVGCYKLVEVINKSSQITITKGSSSNGKVGYYALSVSNCDNTYVSKLTEDNGYIIYTDGAEKVLVGYAGTKTALTLPSYVTTINQYAFYNCSSLTSIEIPDSVTSIGEDAFFWCNSLTSVVIGDSVTSIGDSAFFECFKVVEVINKSSHITVTKGSSSNGKVGYYALSVSNCDNTYVSKLTKDNGYIIYTDGAEKILVGYTGTETALTLPSYVTKIYQYAFWYCDSLTSVVIPDSVTSIGDYAFYECYNLTSVVIPDSVTSIGDSAFAFCDSLTRITVSEDNANFKDIDGNLYTKDGKTLLQYAIGKKDTSFTIPNGVETIGSHAFYNCNSLTSVVIGDSVTSIGDFAFEGCDSLTSVEIGNSVTSIGDFAFRDCSSLTSVEIGNSVTSIGNWAFYDCESLTSIKYRGTQSQWKAISKGHYWDDYTGDYTITYNYTGE